MKIFFIIAIALPTNFTYSQNLPIQNISKALIPHAQHKTVAGKDTVIESDTPAGSSVPP